MKKALVCGAGGFIGGHLVKYLKDKGYWVRGVDLKHNEWQPVHEFCDEFVQADLRDPEIVSSVVSRDLDEIYQLAADMGGAGFVFTGENDADIMHNSALINLNIAHEASKKGVKKVFYSSSACMYPEHNQMDPDNPNCSESSAYPANPDSEYGWEKLFSQMAIDISGKKLIIHNINGDEFVKKYGHKCPIGVNGRNSDNTLYREKVGWVVSRPLIEGMKKTYEWVNKQVKR
jgi:nucleoside-diphosphate-sugar epimerase